MRFPPSFLERLRAQLMLSEVIGRRITLKRHGREFLALCPFHNEKTPSFTVNDDKGFFHCFGCAAHGDAIGFVMQHDRLTYPEAVERLAREAGVALPEMTPEESRRFEQEKTQLSVLEAACRWFEQQLAAPVGTAARGYLEKRGLRLDTIRRFRVGYAPDEKTALHQYLLQAGFSAGMQREAGLIVQTDDGHIYDRFRGRIIFPIRNPRGNVVAFGGRLIHENPDKPLAKYLNSPETSLFKKGELLFNLDLAKRPARDRQRVVVMEGYMDVASVAQAGVDYAVATLGTAVTQPHLAKLWQLAKEPVLCLDGDAAGSRAMARAAEAALPLLKPGYSLRFAILPKGEDPDSYIQKHGKASFENVIGHAHPLYQSLWETLWQRHQHTLSVPESRAELEASCRRIVDGIRDATVKKHYADYFESQLWQHVRKASRTAVTRAPQVTHLSSLEDPQAAAIDTLAARALHLLIDFPPLLHKSAVEEALSHLNIRDAWLASLRDVLFESLGHPHIDNREALLAYVQERLPEYGRLAGKNNPHPHTALTLESAWQLWNETLAAYQIACLQDELKALQQEAGHNMDEETYQRMVELQEAIKKAQAARNFAPLSSDAA